MFYTLKNIKSLKSSLVKVEYSSPLFYVSIKDVPLFLLHELANIFIISS